MLLAILASTPASLAQSIVCFGAQRSPVTDAAFSPDHGLVLIGYRDGTAKIWDAGAGEPLAELRGHRLDISRVAYSPDGERVLTAGRDGLARLWDARMADTLHVFEGQSGRYILDARFSPDGKRAVTGSVDGTACVYDTNSGKLLSVLRGHAEEVSWTSFSSDGQLVLTASMDDLAFVWDADSFEPLARFKSGIQDLVAACFSPSGWRFAAAGSDGRVVIVDTTTGEVIDSLKGHESEAVSSICFSADDQLFLTADTDGTMQVWSSDTGRLVRTFQAGAGIVTYAAFDQGGRRLLTAHAREGSPMWGHGRVWLSKAPTVPVASGVRLWDIRSGALERTIEAGIDPGFVRFDPSGERLLTAPPGEPLRIWNASTGLLEQVLGNALEPVHSVAFHPGGERLVGLGPADLHFSCTSGQALAPLGRRPGLRSAPGGEPGLRVWPTCSTARAYSWTDGTASSGPKDPLEGGSRVYVSPDGRTAIALLTKEPDGSGPGIERALAWDTQSGAHRFVLPELSSRAIDRFEQLFDIDHVDFSPDSSRIVLVCPELVLRDKVGSESDSFDYSVLGTGWVVDAHSGRVLSILDPGQPARTCCASFDSKGDRVVTSDSEGRIRVWSALTGKLLLQMDGGALGVAHVCFSPDGERIAFAAEDGRTRVWDADAPTLLATLAGHEGAVTSACFSPDGRRIATSSKDHTMRLWEADSGRLVATFARFTDGEWVCFTPSLHFTGTPRAAERFQVLLGGLCYPLDHYASTLESPEKVAAVLRGEPVEAPTIFPAPTLIVSSPQGRESTASERSLVLKALASAPRIGVRRLHVFQDEHALEAKRIERASTRGDDRDTLQLALEIEFPPDARQTTVSVHAEDMRGTRCREQTFTIRFEPPSRDLYLLALGVADYEQDALDLEFPVRDAESLAAALGGQVGSLYRSVHVERRTDGEVSAAEVLRLRDRFLLRAGEDDTIVVFAAGHGVRTATNSYWFLTSPCTGSDPYGGISREVLESLVGWDKLRARRRVLVLDTCHSGVDLEGRAGESVSVYRQDEVDQALHDRGGLYILAASSDDELAAEGEGNGLFTGELLRGLAGAADLPPSGDGDGYVQVEELKRFAEVSVLERSGGKQRPTFPRVQGGENFPLAKVLATAGGGEVGAEKR